MLDTLIERIRAAHENRSPLIIQGGGSKTFYGGADEGEVLSSRVLTGVVDYQPKELVLTARAGTPLAEIEALLAEQGQMLAFEPPHFGGPATLGGSIAAGLSGPRRPMRAPRATSCSACASSTAPASRCASAAR